LVVPWDTPASEVLAQNPDGVFLSNGPGDPDAVRDTYEQVQVLLGNVPIFGICLGHQMICKAAGARMEKLKFGHHGGNQPVVNLLTGRVEITAQNHGFNLVFPSLGEPENESENVSSTHFQNAPAYWENIAENESKIRSLTHSAFRHG
jgi:carbamoyl-phosphate synthase small subunit